MKMRNRFVLGALCSLLLLSACGCSGGPAPQASHTPAASKKGEGTIRLMHAYTGHEDAMEEMICSIEQNEGIAVELTAVPWSAVERELASALAAADMYDVFSLSSQSLERLHRQGLLLELDEFMDESWSADFLPGALEEYRVGGALCGVPFQGSGLVVLYNKDLFGSMGWREPGSQEELTALMQLALNQGLTPIAAAGRPDGLRLNALRGMVTDYLLNVDGKLDEPERLSGRKTDWQGKLARGAQYVKTWTARGYFGPNPLSVDQDAARAAFLGGKAAMLLCDTNELHDLRAQENYLPFEMDCFLFPGPEANKEKLFESASFSQGFAVWAGVDRPEQAVRLLRGLTDKERCARWSDQTLAVTAVAGVECQDELLAKFSGYFSIAGRHRVRPDYALGDSESLKEQLFVDYLSSDMTADEFETNYEVIVKNAVQASDRK